MEDFKKKELKELESLGDTELQNGAVWWAFGFMIISHK